MSDLINVHNGNNMRIVVVGNGMVGHHFVEQLIQQNNVSTKANNDIQLDIVVLSAEPRLAYDRVHLSEYFSGKTAEELALTTPEYYQAHNIKFALNAKVININKLAKSVTTEAGDVFEPSALSWVGTATMARLSGKSNLETHFRESADRTQVLKHCERFLFFRGKQSTLLGSPV